VSTTLLKDLSDNIEKMGERKTQFRNAKAEEGRIERLVKSRFEDLTPEIQAKLNTASIGHNTLAIALRTHVLTKYHSIVAAYQAR
jgi:hypothetical protein